MQPSVLQLKHHKQLLQLLQQPYQQMLDALDYTVNAETTPKILAAYEAYKNYKELNGSNDANVNIQTFYSSNF